MVVDALFYMFSSFLVFFSMLVILVPNPVYAALSLVVCFFAASVLWLLMQAEFIAIMLILLYVGAVMVLFLFVIMMFRVDYNKWHKTLQKNILLLVVVVCVFITEVCLSVYLSRFSTPLPVVVHDVLSNTQTMGRFLFSQYLYPFELIGVLITMAVLAAVVLAIRETARTNTLQQSVAQQVLVTKADRLKIIQMDPIKDHTQKGSL